MNPMLVVLAFLAGITVVPAWADPAASERESLVLGVAENAGDMPTFIALEKGFFRDEGLDITTKSWSAGKLALEAMFRGEVDMATVADTPIVMQSFKRRDFVVIATFSHNTPYRLVADRDAGIHTPADLRGHKVGVMVGTTSQFFLHSVLADLGIAPSEITEINVPAENSADAIVNNRVDAIAAFDPHGYHAEVMLKDRALVIPYNKKRLDETFNFATLREFAQKRPIAAQRLLRATERAINWTREHRSEAITLVAHRLKIDEKILQALWGNYRHELSLDQVLIESLETQARWAIRNGMVAGKEVTDYLDYLDTYALDAIRPSAVTLIR